LSFFIDTASPAALLADFLRGPPLTSTGRTIRYPDDLPKSGTLELSEFTGALASSAGDDFTTRFRADSFTVTASFRSLDGDFPFKPGEGLLEGNLQVITEVHPALAMGGSAALLTTHEDIENAAKPSAAKAAKPHTAEQVFEVDTAEDIFGAIPTGDTRVPKTVVHAALLLIGEHSVGFGNLPELLSSIRFLVAVWVVFEGQLPVSALNLLW
jgi:hypothetical protein